MWERGASTERQRGEWKHSSPVADLSMVQVTAYKVWPRIHLLLFGGIVQQSKRQEDRRRPKEGADTRRGGYRDSRLDEERLFVSPFQSFKTYDCITIVYVLHFIIFSTWPHLNPMRFKIHLQYSPGTSVKTCFVHYGQHDTGKCSVCVCVFQCSNKGLLSETSMFYGNRFLNKDVLFPCELKESMRCISFYTGALHMMHAFVQAWKINLKVIYCDKLKLIKNALSLSLWGSLGRQGPWLPWDSLAN